MDALSDVLKSVRLEGAIYRNAEFTAPWCIRARHGLDAVRGRIPGAEAVLFFHYVAEGSCKVKLKGGEGIAHAGDLILFLQDERQLMGSDLHVPPVEVGPTVPPSFESFRLGGGGERTRFVCGYLGYSRTLCRPLFDALPRGAVIPMGDGEAAKVIRDLLKVGVRESDDERPGAASLLARLSELVFVDALRRYVESVPERNRGWLAGLRDAHVGHALALIHGDPSHGWTVDDLAREVAMSRSAFGERFAALVGEPPMQYLLRWRLALAAEALRISDEAITRVAQRSGYESDAAFNRAFKREFGMPPAAWRKAATR